MSFADQVLESVAPWSDPSGFWDTYNAALASMFEDVFGIVADTGDVLQTNVAALSVPLSTAGPITSFAVQSVAQEIFASSTITVAFAQSVQSFVLAADAQVGSQIIFVESATPNFPYPVGSSVQQEYVPGWSTLLDPVNCPDLFLPFLAEFNGTDVPVGLDAATARAKILGESALQRGTRSSIASAVRRNLTGSQSVVIEERIDASGNPNAYWFVVVVRPEEVVSVSALSDSVNAVKPGGVQWTLVQTDGWTISQMESSQATISALEANFVTITGLENDQPGS